MRHLLMAMSLGTLAVACGDSDSEDDGHHEDVHLELGDPGAGGVLFADDCAKCHGVEGTGGAGDTDAPSLVEKVPAHTDEQLLGIITNGTGDMPPRNLNMQEIGAVIAYLRQQFGAFAGASDHDDGHHEEGTDHEEGS